MTLNENDKYFNEVIKRWDEASWSFLNACKEGNRSSRAHYLNMINPDESIRINEHPDRTHVTKLKAVKETIDGVGTKVQIYTNQFENVFQTWEKKEIDGKTAKKQATELRERMLMDLIAMNSDDLRGGELAICATNIIDINHLRWARGHLFQDSMADAMKKVIQTTWIAMTAGETAVLGMSHEAAKMYAQIQKTLEDIQNILIEDRNRGDGRGPSRINQPIQDILQTFDDTMKIRLEEISFNIWWTCTGLTTEHNKLIPLEDGQMIVGFQEIPADGIIWPRSNGITKIREDMKTIMGDWRENKAFEDFLEKIWPEKSAKIPEEVKNVCKGKRMRDIATGKTTVFNPFIAHMLLGWVESQPEVWVSKIIHVTGNPLKKISEWINKDKEKTYTVNLDISDMPTPQIIILLQAVLDIPDEQAMNKRNMGVPYAIVCNGEDYKTIIDAAQINGITAKAIGIVKKPIFEWNNTIVGVGLNKSSMTF